MQEPPPVTITDPSRPPAPRSSGGQDELGPAPDDLHEGPPPLPGPSVPRPLRGWRGLAAAAAAGFVAATVLPQVVPSDDGTQDRALLALVVGSQPLLTTQPGPDPAAAVEVALVNTGPDPVRLTGAVVDGLGLRWAASKVLEPGGQSAVVLRQADPCAWLARQPRATVGRQELRVSVAASADDLPDEVALPLPAALVIDYDAFARSSCGLPPVSQGLDVLAEPQTLGEDEVLVPVGLVSQTVVSLRLVDVAPTVPGLVVELRDPAGGLVPLPLEVPGRYLVDLDIGFGPGVPEVDRYVVSVRTDDEGCAVLQDEEVRAVELAQLFWVAEDEPTEVAATSVGDLSRAVREACG